MMFYDQFQANIGPPIPTTPPEWISQQCLFHKQCSFGGLSFTAKVWDGVEDPPTSALIGVDTETLKIRRNGDIPPVVCGQFYFHDARLSLVVMWWMLPAFMERMHRANRRATYILHNGAFDYYVLGGKKCEVLHLALLEDRYVDTGLRYLLNRMGKGLWQTTHIPWSLDHVIATLYNGLYLPKDDEIRLAYNRGEPLDEAKFDYAVLDPVAAYLAYARMPDKEPTESLQCRASVVLEAISHRGMLVDMPRRRELQLDLKSKMEDAETTLQVFGMYKGKEFKGIKGKQGVLQQLMGNIELRSGLCFPRTAGGVSFNKKTGKMTERKPMISTSSKLIELFPDKCHPLLASMKQYSHAEKLLSTFLNDAHIMEDGRTHSRFTTMVRTGRTSGRDPNPMNMPRGDGIRTAWKAALGYVLLAVDYSQQELVALAETCWQRFGKLNCSYCTFWVVVIHCRRRYPYGDVFELRQRDHKEEARQDWRPRVCALL